MDNEPENTESRLDRELEAILTPLGVKREGVQEISRPRHNEDLHITCLYSHKDKALWTELQQYLDLLKRRYCSISTWHAHEINNFLSMNDPQVADRIKRDITRADIVLLGLSVDLAISLYEQGRYIYHLLVRRIHDQLCQPEIITILLRAIAWEDDHLPLQPTVPDDGQIGGRRNRDVAYVQVSQAVELAIELCKKRGATQ